MLSARASWYTSGGSLAVARRPQPTERHGFVDVGGRSLCVVYLELSASMHFPLRRTNECGVDARINLMTCNLQRKGCSPTDLPALASNQAAAMIRD